MVKVKYMQKWTIILVVAVIAIVVIAGGYIGYNSTVNQPSASPSPSPSPAVIPQEEARETIMMFIASNHTETKSLTNGIVWVGGRATPEGIVGAETYIYTGNGWNVTIQNPVVADPIYHVSATYTTSGSQQVTVDWQGTYQHGVVTETKYFRPGGSSWYTHYEG